MSECRINGGCDTRCDYGTGGCTVNHENEDLRATVAALEQSQRGALIEELRVANRELRLVKADLSLVRTDVENVWRWQGDAHDDPVSLSCPVVMSPETLRSFVATAARVIDLEATIASLCSERDEANAAQHDAFRTVVEMSSNEKHFTSRIAELEATVAKLRAALVSGDATLKAEALTPKNYDERVEMGALDILMARHDIDLYAAHAKGVLEAKYASDKREELCIANEVKALAEQREAERQRDEAVAEMDDLQNILDAHFPEDRALRTKETP